MNRLYFKTISLEHKRGRKIAVISKLNRNFYSFVQPLLFAVLRRRHIAFRTHECRMEFRYRCLVVMNICNAGKYVRVYIVCRAISYKLVNIYMHVENMKLRKNCIRPQRVIFELVWIRLNLTTALFEILICRLGLSKTYF